MKKLFTFCIIYIAATLLLASCSTSSSITKRRYTKGYYVQHHHNKKAVSPGHAAERVQQQPVATAPETINSPSELKTPNAVAENKPVKKDHTALMPVKPEKLHPKAAKLKPIKHATEESDLVFNDNLQQQHAVLNASKPYADSGDALSLFWIIILIILILWLLGVISGGWGLGILINLLLIIALILLILWLLRIV